MTIELWMLVWSIVLGLVHVMATGQVATAQHGFAYNMGPRDEQKPVTGWGGRVIRAYANFQQTFPFFAAAVLMAHVTGHHGWQTVLGAQLYFWARLVYIPLYVAGVVFFRSLAFVVSLCGILLLLDRLAIGRLAAGQADAICTICDGIVTLV